MKSMKSYDNMFFLL